MLDKLINDNVDKQEELEVGINKDIDNFLKQINIDDIINDAESTLLQFTDMIQEILLKDYAPKAIQNGIEVGKKISNLKRDIVIQKTNDPKLNKGEVDIGSNDGVQRQD